MDFLQPLAAVGFVLALLGVTLMLLKRRGAASFHLPRLQGAGPRRLQSIERLSLGPNHALHLIQIDGRAVLLATAPNNCQIVYEAESK